MKKTLIIVRHGNTFLPEQTPTRVGGRTDLPLVEEKRARAVGKYLLSQNMVPDKVYAAPLLRTTQTAKLALDEMHLPLNIIPQRDFVEIDYGPDENKTEEDVLYRLGELYILKDNILEDNKEQILNKGRSIIEAWDQQAVVPDGWSVDVNSIIGAWTKFADSIGDGETILLCSSNGIIRFAPHILEEVYDDFCKSQNIKVATGSVSIFEFYDGIWHCKEWNTKPYNLF